MEDTTGGWAFCSMRRRLRPFEVKPNIGRYIIPFLFFMNQFSTYITALVKKGALKKKKKKTDSIVLLQQKTDRVVEKATYRNTEKKHYKCVEFFCEKLVGGLADQLTRVVRRKNEKINANGDR